MSKATTKEVRALLETASEMFDETGCVPGIDGEEVRAETMVTDAKEYISETRMHLGLRWSFRGWHKYGSQGAYACISRQ